jgi:peroxiredoxin
MYTIVKGNTAPEFYAESVNGRDVSFSDKKHTLLCFFRFATCPFCNLRLSKLQEWANMHTDVQIVGVFGSPAREVQKAQDIHSVSFPLVADTAGKWYAAYGIKKSFLGMLIGMIRRFPQLVQAMMRGYFPKNPHGHLTTMPAEFLISPHKKVIEVYYGKDEGDHIPLTRVEAAIASSSE